MDGIIIRGVGACMSLLLQSDTCDLKPWRFTEFYDAACYHRAEGAVGGNWAGRGMETTETVQKRVIDGVAEYQDYLENRRSMCGKKEK